MCRFAYMVHIGQKVKEIFESKGISVVEFAKRINTSRENIYGIFKRKTIDVELLFKISEVLEHNFFEYYLSPNFSPYPQIEDLREKLQVAEQEIEYLKQINKLLKDRQNNQDT